MPCKKYCLKLSNLDRYKLLHNTFQNYFSTFRWKLQTKTSAGYFFNKSCYSEKIHILNHKYRQRYSHTQLVMFILLGSFYINCLNNDMFQRFHRPSSGCSIISYKITITINNIMFLLSTRSRVHL